MPNNIIDYGDCLGVVTSNGVVIVDEGTLERIKREQVELFISFDREYPDIPKVVCRVNKSLVRLKKFLMGEVDCVVHRNGDPYDFRLDNLKEVSRAEYYLWGVDLINDEDKCIRSEGERYKVVLLGRSYGIYSNKAIALECRNKAITDIRNGDDLDAKYYRNIYVNKDKVMAPCE